MATTDEMLNILGITTRDCLALAYKTALESPDPSSQNGAVLIVFNEKDFKSDVISACNKFPKGVNVTEERLSDRDLKLIHTEHAERGVIYEAARRGYALEGKTLFVPWFACDSCGRAIICSGIKKVVGHKKIMDATPERWRDSIAYALRMLEEAGVETELYDGEFPELPKIRFNKELWQP